MDFDHPFILGIGVGLILWGILGMVTWNSTIGWFSFMSGVTILLFLWSKERSGDED